MRKVNGVVVVAGAGLLAAALVTELRKPSTDRTWHGTVAGLVPYDFRLPTPERLRTKLWNPDGPLIVPHVWGVGWAPNLGRLVRPATRRSRFRHR